MIWDLQLSRHRRAKVWFDEAPECKYSPSGVVRQVLSTGDPKPTVNRSAAIELMVPRGAIANYGLLGAELTDDGQDVGTVCVAVNKIGVPMNGSLALMPDDVRVGLLDEYVAAIISGVACVVDEGWRYRGELNFRWAAHAAVGSSPAFFSELSVFVARLIAKPLAPSEAELMSMLR